MKYKTKDEYYDYLDNLHTNAKQEMIELEKNEKLTEDDAAFKHYYYVKCNADYRYLMMVKEGVSDDLFEHINAYDIPLDLIDLFTVISTIKDLNFFKKSKLSDDGKEHKREIKQLKKNADRLQLFSETQIEIRLPQLPHVVLKLLLNYFESKSVLSKKDLDNFFTFFERRKPRSGVKYTEELKEQYNAIGIKIHNELDKGKDYTEKDIINKVIDETEYYKPDIRTSFFYDEKSLVTMKPIKKSSLEEKFIATFGGSPEEILPRLLKAQLNK